MIRVSTEKKKDISMSSKRETREEDRAQKRFMLLNKMWLLNTMMMLFIDNMQHRKSLSGYQHKEFTINRGIITMIIDLNTDI